MDEIEVDDYTETDQFANPEFDSGGDLASESELYSDLQQQTEENNVDSEIHSEFQEVEPVNKETPAPLETIQRLEIVRFTKLPMSRIKSIMKMDPDMHLASAEAVFLVTKATELFLQTIVKEAYTYTAKSKKKTVTKKDLDTVIETVDALCFLDGALDF